MRGAHAVERGLGMGAPAFLLAQVGAFAAARFAERLARVGFTPAQAGVLRIVATAPGINQRSLSERLGVLPARLVGLVDELERRGLVERRRDPDDRRNHALHLADAGGRALAAIGAVAREHQDDMCAALDPEERETLAALLRRLAEHHGLTPGVHPGFQHL